MVTARPLFRADHVGSLRRPDKLVKAREQFLGDHDLDHNFGPHHHKELSAIEDECIRDVVQLQEGTGLHSITDGEFRRRIWWSEFLLSLDGVSGNYRGPKTEFRDKSGHTVPTPRIEVTGPIRWTESVNVGPFKFLKSVTKRTPKVTIPAPQTLYFYTTRETISRDAYPDLDLFWDDLATAYINELNELGDAGCTYVQFDEIVTSCLCDEAHRAKLKSRGEDPDALLKHYAQTINKIADNRPAGMTIAMHTCRGNYQGHWMAEGGYDPIAEYVFNSIRVDTFFLEYDSDRAGSFSPLRFVPSDRSVVLGLVSSKSPDLEHPEDLKRRIDEASKYISVGQLGLSPQCGFSSNYLGNPVTIDDERKKLKLVVDVADAVWGNA